MIRIKITGNEFRKWKENKKMIQQEVVGLIYKANIIRKNTEEKVFIVGKATFTGETPDFYELSEFQWETSNNLDGEWNNHYDRNSFINGNYSLEDYVDDGIIDEIISEQNVKVAHEYYLTNLPPASEISMNNPVNMDIEAEYDGTNTEITSKIISALDWRKYYAPDPNGLGTVDVIQFLGNVLSRV